ncbi:SEC-C metal-binding domain-containing protein, partial [Campylobacter jejuni]
MKGKDRNKLCWCGSGKKFKKCHIDRENQSPIRQSDFI